MCLIFARTRALRKLDFAAALTVLWLSLAANAAEIRVGGTGNALGTMRLLGSEFAKRHPEYKAVVLDSLGTSGAIKAVPKGTIDVGLSSRPLTGEEVKSGLTTVDYASSPTVFAVSRTHQTESITLAQIADIYGGKLTSWPDGTRLRPVMRQPGDDNTRQIKRLSAEIEQALVAAEQREGLSHAAHDQEAADKIESVAGSIVVSKAIKFTSCGEIGLHREAGRGTLFWFDIPLRKQNPDARTVINMSKRLDGLRVLVAEDNPVNQQVALAMLESLGLHCHLADNGRLAIKRLQREAFDLVLMDCQMPKMDGFEATAEIRARQGDGRLRRRLPIVALTANAVAGDRERRLAAGMNDYLSKPFSRERLLATLQRWLPLATTATQIAPAPSATPVAKPIAKPVTPAQTTALSGGGQINPRALDTIRRLPGPNAAALVNEVVGAYLADTPRRLAQMHAAAAAGDAEALRKTAHALKSSSANVGAEQLARLCRELETLTRKEAVDGAKPLLEVVEFEIPRVLALLATILAESPDHATA